MAHLTRRVWWWHRVTQPHVLLALIVLALSLYLIVAPFVTMVSTTFVFQESDTRLSRDYAPGEWTLFRWQRLLTGLIAPVIFYEPLVNSLITSLGMAAGGVVIGALLAWLVVRTDLPFRGLVATLATVPYTLPSWTITFAWLALFKNERVGGTKGLWMFLTGTGPPDWLAYGAVPIIITLTLHYFPYTFLLVSAALTSIDAGLEEAGDILGANRLRILRRITFPLVTPALLSAFILTFSRGLGIFSVPYFLGLPVRYFTLSTMIYTSIDGGREADGYALATVLILISAIVIYVNQRMLGTRRSFVTIAGKGWRARVTPLGKARWFALGAVALLLFVAVVIPLGLLAWQSLMLMRGDYSLENLTLHYWIGEGIPQFAEGEAGILRNSLILGAAWNSIALSVSVALLTGLAGIFIGYAIVKGRGTRLAQWVDQVTFLPYLVPAIAFGAIYLAMFLKPVGPLPALYGTFFLVVLTCVVKNLPFSARAGVASMLQVAGELEEAAAVAGASWWRRFRKIIFPLTLSGALSGFLLTFISTMRELSLIILLITPATRTLTTMTFRYAEQGYDQFADAIILLLVALILIGEWIAQRLGQKQVVGG